MDNFNKTRKDKSSTVLISISVFAILVLVGVTIFFVRKDGGHLMTTTQIDLLPMYGGVKKSSVQIKADQDFIDTALKSGDNKTVAAGIVNGAWEFAKQGDLQTAMKRFNEAWLLDQNNWDIYKGYVSIIPPSQYKDLYTYAEKVLAQNPNSATLQCFLGVIHNNMFLASTDKNVNSLNQGEVEFQKGLAIDVNNPFCQLNFAANLYHNGKYQEAWDHLVINSTLPYSRYDNKLTLDIYAKAPVLNSANAYNLMGSTYRRLNQTNDAFVIFQKGASLYPNDASMVCGFGAVYSDKWYNILQSNPNESNTFIRESEKYLEMGIKLDPQSAFCHESYAYALYYDHSFYADIDYKFLKIWPEVEKAKSLGWTFDPKFITDLQQRISPEPKQ